MSGLSAQKRPGRCVEKCRSEIQVCALRFILVCTNVDHVSLHNDENPKVDGDGTIYLRRESHDDTFRPSSFDGLVVNPSVLVVSTFMHTRIIAQVGF